ncbi:MAG: hypothetical protein JSU57_00895 [Candidatus Heimdallarchaeota archaeon]|nr:MAG: hypothetical protein JSU57_00895 [Candidatus Heimdallarchaeota archaeon]
MSPPYKSTKKKSPKIDVKDLPQPPSVLDQEISSLSAPPAQSLDILTRPPFPESPTKPPVHDQDSIIIQDNITNDILKELRQGEFGSILQHVPDKRPLTLDEIEGPRFLAAKDDYLAAGKKHLELNFYENAAMNFACAILSMYLGKDVFAAAHLMSELASMLPPPIVNSYFFQGAKLFLKGILLKNRSSLIQSEKWLLKNTDHLYKEDIDLIKRALRQSEIIIEQS